MDFCVKYGFYSYEKLLKRTLERQENMNEQCQHNRRSDRRSAGGKIILVTDDPDRENEGDMICAAEFATQANINLW